MPMSSTHRATLHKLVLGAYAMVEDLDLLLQRDLGLALDDLAKDGTRPQRYFAAVGKLDELRRIPDLFAAIYADRPEDTALHDKLADLFNDIWPEGQPDKPHLHLLVDNVAFVNRDRLRDVISDLVETATPRVMLLRGRSLAGASHARHLIQHVANARGGIDLAWLNFDWVQPQTPPVAMQLLADGLNLGDLPQRNDLLGAGGLQDPEAPQLVATLCNWFLGKARDRVRTTGQALWIMIDNAHRDTAPAPMRDLVARLIEIVGAGTVKDLHLFILGADRTLPIRLPFAVEELEVSPLGRPDIVTYLAALMQRRDAFAEFPNADAAADAVLAACDLAAPQAEALLGMTRGLTELARRLR